MNDTITIDRKVVEQALEALESCNNRDYAQPPQKLHPLFKEFEHVDVASELAKLRVEIQALREAFVATKVSPDRWR